MSHSIFWSAKFGRHKLPKKSKTYNREGDNAAVPARKGPYELTPRIGPNIQIYVCGNGSKLGVHIVKVIDINDVVSSTRVVDCEVGGVIRKSSGSVYSNRIDADRQAPNPILSTKMALWRAVPRVGS